MLRWSFCGPCSVWSFSAICSCTKQTTVNESNVSRVTGEAFVTTQYIQLCFNSAEPLHLIAARPSRQIILQYLSADIANKWLWWSSPPPAACGLWKVDVSGKLWGHINRTKRNMQPISLMQTNGRIFYRQSCFLRPLCLLNIQTSLILVFGKCTVVCIL